MDSKRLRGVATLFCLVAVCALLLSGPVSAQANTSKTLSTITIKQGTLSGVVFNPRGKQLEKVTVSVKDAAGKVVAKAVTGKKGAYAIKDLKVGKYSVYVGDLKAVGVQVTRGSKMSTLKIVTPATGVKRSTPGGSGAPKKAGGGKYRFTTIKMNSNYYTIGTPVAAPGAGSPTNPPPGNVSP